MGSAVLEVGRSANIHKFCFQYAKHSDMDYVDLQCFLFADCKERHFQVSKLSDNCRNILPEGRFMMFTKTGFRVRNEICAVLSSNEVDLLMLRNRVCKPRNDKKCAVYS